MPYTAVRPRRPGRPRLDRERRVFGARYEEGLVAVLQKQAEQVGIPFGSYLELLLAQVHDYHGEYLAEVTAPLPTAVPVDELLARTERLREEPTLGAAPSVGLEKKARSVRTDPPLADAIDRRCRELDVAYSDYLRALFREAAGLAPAPTGVHQQAASIDSEGRLRLAKAS